MNLANRLTLSRIILAPVFFASYLMLILFSQQCAGLAFWLIPLIWIIVIVSELTDMFDGIAARRLNQGSDFGKLFDPFADTLMQLTIFVCFVMDDIFPKPYWTILFLVILYREFGILFLRNLMLRKGIAMGARISGKIKTVSYITTVVIAMSYATLKYLAMLEPIHLIVQMAANVVFGISAVISVASFFDYARVYRSANQ